MTGRWGKKRSGRQSSRSSGEGGPKRRLTLSPHNRQPGERRRVQRDAIGGEDLGEVFRVRGAEDGENGRLLVEQPGERDLRRRAAQAGAHFTHALPACPVYRVGGTELPGEKPPPVAE